MRRIAACLVAGVVGLALWVPPSFAQPPGPVSAAVPLPWLETGGRVFAGGGTPVSNGVFFPGTVLCVGTDCSGLPPVEIAKGTDLEFVNLDASTVANIHQMVSYKRKRGRPLFTSKAVEGPAISTVVTSHLKPGVYRFFCSTHYGMDGAIKIVP